MACSTTSNYFYNIFFCFKKIKIIYCREFVEIFDACVGKKNGKISIEEFFKYFDYMSVDIEDDTYFEKIIQNTWLQNTTPRPFKVFIFYFYLIII
jgi:hypothetical protein